MLNLVSILSREIPASTKGAPAALSSGNISVTVSNVKEQGWSILAEDLPLPVAVIRQSTLSHNQSWMKHYLDERGIHFAPHGKTTMSPQLFDMQLRHGAWGITVASVQQLKICRRFGVQRVFLANQLVGRDDIRFVARELARDPEFEFYCLVDSLAGVQRLDEQLEGTGGRSVRALIEVGLVDGRTGARTYEEAIAVASEVASSSNLKLCGVECYEGIAVSDNEETDRSRVESLLLMLERVYQHCSDNALFCDEGAVILSAGGTTYFDIVSDFLQTIAHQNTIVLIRSGCYLTHSFFYRRLAARMKNNEPGEPCGLTPAFEVWGCVQSVPEHGLALLSVGKRDISYDIELPKVEKWFRAGRMDLPQLVGSEFEISDLNDHHAYVKFSEAETLEVGDLLSLGCSHPCTTFDKWKLIWIVDDSYRVISGIWTFF